MHRATQATGGPDPGGRSVRDAIHLTGREPLVATVVHRATQATVEDADGGRVGRRQTQGLARTPVAADVRGTHR